MCHFETKTFDLETMRRKYFFKNLPPGERGVEIKKLGDVFVPSNPDVFMHILWLGNNIMLNVMQFPTKKKPWLSNTLDNVLSVLNCICIKLCVLNVSVLNALL